MSEMEPSYAPKYPFNDVKSTPGGHLFEMDDTPGAERVQVTHRSGTHIEMRPDGSVKYKSVKKRQDVTIGDHDIIIQGDFNITVDGGSKILVRNGALEIQADYGAAVNVKGELKLAADNIKLQAKKKISLAAPFVDIGGGVGMTPYMSLPYGVAPIFGIPMPVLTGLSVPKIAGIPVPSGSGLDAIPGLITTAAAIANQVNTAASYAKNIGKSKQLIATMKDAALDPLIPEIDQPEELPLTNPKLYSGVNIDRIRLRDRQFDSPDDVSDAELYTAHVNLCEELKDLIPSDKDLPGQKTLSDDSVPANEPIPVTSFSISGTVVCRTGNTSIIGTSTKFTSEAVAGQTINVNGRRGIIKSVLSDTELTLTLPWAYEPVEATPYVHVYRPFAEFYDVYKYATSAPLGTSGLALRDLMTNYIPPTIEKDSTGISVPSVPPTPKEPLGGSAGTITPRESYQEAV